MNFIADFHIHSHFSLATSKNLIPEYLDYWAKVKGIHVVGTGDCVHPGWLSELKEKLTPAGNGLYQLKKEYLLKDHSLPIHDHIPEEVYFMLTTEISSIYKKNGKVRKVHNVCVFPDFDSVEKIQAKLEKIGNIRSDGRPILGLDSKILLEMVLEQKDNSFLIPAHIWTPWFSVLGSKSGFDSIEECFEDLSQHIFAVETGLSSDPAMNRVCSFLDQYKLVSNSDAHSPEKLGREANLFDTELTYNHIYNALKGDEGFLGTIEFFPQEGKYHYDGHRKCQIKWTPLETLQNNGICSVCGKPVTKGVLYRVAELADRAEQEDKFNYYSITPLPDLVSELLGVKSSAAKKVKQEYDNLIQHLGSEFHILLFSQFDEIKKWGGDDLAEGIRRLRNGKVIIEEGFDGQFGRIKVFKKGELHSKSGESLFIENNPLAKSNGSYQSIKFDIDEFKILNQNQPKESENKPIEEVIAENRGQQEGIEHFEGPCMILAGPGSGKTKILTDRIFHLITNKNINPENILAISFSNKAVEEIRKRVSDNYEHKSLLKKNITTFHSLGLSIIRNHHDLLGLSDQFCIIDEDEIKSILFDLTGEKKGLKKKIKLIESFKQGLIVDQAIETLVNSYNDKLKSLNSLDLSDLIFLTVQLFHNNQQILEQYQTLYQWILVDEYQDINAKQYELIRLLAGSNNPNLFVIGDPDQAIYGFRGSDIRFIDEFKKDYPNTKLIQLERSYRCPEVVLKIAGQVLNKQDYLLGKAKKMKIHIQECETEKSEGDWIATQIEKMMGGTRSFSIDSGVSDGQVSTKSFADFAILCRSSFMFSPIIKALNDHGIAYQVIGQEPFYKTEPYHSIIQIFRQHYYRRLDLYNSKIEELIDQKAEISIILSLLMGEQNLNSDVQEPLIRLAKEFENNYDQFFQSLSIRQSIDDHNNTLEAVSLITLHGSKGLEFDVVFIAGCEDRIIPFQLFDNKNEEELKEEERLFYVGATRTLQNLYLSYSKKREYKGRVLQQEKSPFLNRLEKKLYDLKKRESKKHQVESQLDLF